MKNAPKWLNTPEEEKAVLELIQKSQEAHRQAMEKLESEKAKAIAYLDFINEQMRQLKFSNKVEHAVYANVTDEMIIEFLEEEATSGEVQDEFSFSPKTVVKRMDALLKAKKVTLRREGNTKIWKAKS